MNMTSQSGGGLVYHLRKSYSLSDLLEEPLDTRDDTDSSNVVISDPRLIRRRQSPHKTNSLYFPEVDVRKDLAHIQSVEDISSGYSSGDGFSTTNMARAEGLVRSGSIGSVRARVTRVTRSSVIRRNNLGVEDIEDETYQQFCKTDTLPISNAPENPVVEKQDCTSEAEFLDSVEGPKTTQIVETPTVTSPAENTFNKPTTEKPCDQRAGRYNKKPAPIPPQNPSAIKATLILKPGIIRNLGSSSENVPEIFVSHSPKVKRRAKSKSNSPISRFLMLPKKIFNKDDLEQEDFKRFSWHELFGSGQKLNVGSSYKSRSHEDLGNKFGAYIQSGRSGS